MTNTDTADIDGTIRQCAALARAGSELVRVTVNNDAAAKAVPFVVDGLDRLGIPVPIIGDFHYNGHILLKKYPECARTLAKYRINPGNVSIGKKDDDNFRTMIEVAIENDKPVRIGVNWGSLDQALLTRLMDENSKLDEPKDARDVTMEAMVQSALRSADLAVKYGLRQDQIILSAKVSGVQDLIDVYRELARRCEYPLHLGLTEAGMGAKGIVGSTAAMAVLMQEGIGDTIRVSLTPAPGREPNYPQSGRPSIQKPETFCAEVVASLLEFSVPQRQVGEGLPTRRAMYLATVAWLTSMPSCKSSPSIRGAPSSTTTTHCAATRASTI